MLDSPIQEIKDRLPILEVVQDFVNNQKILLVYKQAHDLWQLPQGGIDNNETVEKAFFREFAEELGESFMRGCDKNIKMLGAKEVKFSHGKKNIRELNSDAGEQLDMKGKKYFFIAANVVNDRVDLSESEFDDYQWLTFAQAISQAQTITQPRKQLTTIKALNLLKKKEVIA